MDHKPSRLGLHAPHLTDFVLSKAKASALKRSIAAAGSRLLALLTRDPYMPGSLKDGIASTFKTTVWPQVTEFLLETLSPDQTRVKANHHREWPECLTVADPAGSGVSVARCCTPFCQQTCRSGQSCNPPGCSRSTSCCSALTLASRSG